MSDIRLIIGLGNPGKQYEYTRHNLGYLVVQHLAKNFEIRFKRSILASGFFAEKKLKSGNLILFIPTTYMNNSGAAVKRLILKKQIALQNILVVCDDFSLDFNQVRIRQKGSSGGHNGLGSIIGHLNTDEFPRLRMGIGLVPKSKDPIDYVLQEFTKKEKEELKDFISKAADCCLVWFEDGINKAMEKFNRRKENGKNSDTK